MLLAEDEAKGDTQAEAPQREASPLGCHGGLATINELGNLRQEGGSRVRACGNTSVSLAPSVRGLRRGRDLAHEGECWQNLTALKLL
jgi:hypothetical protein